jgi:hypothetical protein
VSGRCMKLLLLWQSRTRKSKSEYTNITILIGFVSQLLFLKKKFNWKIQRCIIESITKEIVDYVIVFIIVIVIVVIKKKIQIIVIVFVIA